MSTQNTRPSGRRSGRGARRFKDRDSEPRKAVAPKAPEKKSLWQKILGIFTSKKPATRTTTGPSRTQTAPAKAVTTSRYPSTSTSQTPAPRPTRKPEAVEVTTAKLYVGNLSFDAAESDLQELFQGVGAVQNAEIVTHKQTEKSKGFGFVTMASVEEAKRAVEVLHDKEFMSRKLVVSGAKTPAER